MVLSIVLCLDNAFIVDATSITNEEYLRNIGESLLTLTYSATAADYGELGFCTLLSTALGESYHNLIPTNPSIHPLIPDLLRKISESLKDFAEQHIGHLLGLVKAYMTRGLPIANTSTTATPLTMSQQALFEPNDLVIKKGGKTVKKRKHQNTNKSANAKKILEEDTMEQQAGPGALYNGSRVNWDYVPSVNVASTSDFSHSETEANGGGVARHERRSKQSQLRLSCMLLMERLSKTVHRKTMFGYWNSFIPQQFIVDGAGGLAKPPSIAAAAMLPNLLLMDPSPKCRCMIAQTLSTFVRFSKFFLYQAESDSRVSTSFTAFSVAMGESLVATYRILTRALSGEGHVAVIIQLLKCFSSLIQATPFHKLETGMVTQLVRYVRRLVHHKDLDVKVSSLVIIGFLLAVPEKTVEIREQLGLIPGNVVEGSGEREDKDDVEDGDYEVEREWEEEEEAEEEEHNEKQKHLTDQVGDNLNGSNNSSTTIVTPQICAAVKPFTMSWILRVVLDLLGVKNASDLKSISPRIPPPTPLKVECLHILLAVTSHPELLRGNLKYFTEAATVALEDTSSPECHLFAVRVIDYTGYALSHNLASGSGRGALVVGPGVDECLEYWNTVLPLIATQLQKRPSCQKYFVKPICCDALSNVGGVVFEKMPHHQRAFIIALLQGCFYNNSNNNNKEGEIEGEDEEEGLSLVKASAGRALSVYALFPSLRDDLTFIETTSEMIVSLFADRNVVVRKKCTWSLGNIVEALVEMQRQAGGDPENAPHIQDHYLESFFVACLATAENDHEKVRSNIMRCLGNLVRLLSGRQMREGQRRWHELAMQSVEAVVRNALHFKVVKVKWNACYSMGLMMRNEHMYREVMMSMESGAGGGCDWLERVLTALCGLIEGSANFKVRTAAVIAVAVPRERRWYGGHFEGVWRVLVGALEQAGNLIDFNEYKHRDALLDQLCTSIAHCVLLAEERDWAGMRGAVVPLFEVVKGNWFRVVNRILPEQGAYLISAASRLREMVEGERRLTGEVREAVKVLSECFKPPVEYE